MLLKEKIVGLDLGGTNLRGTCIEGGQEPVQIASIKISAHANAEVIMNEIFSFTDRLVDDDVKAIGMVEKLTDEG